jgi:hypothetical protein
MATNDRREQARKNGVPRGAIEEFRRLEAERDTARAALEMARHELTTLHGLMATDHIGDVPEGSWRIDAAAAIRAIDAVLPAAGGGAQRGAGE